MTLALTLLADLLVLLGLGVMTIGVLGFARMPDIYNKLHAASKAVFLGAISVLMATVATQDATIFGRAALIAAFLLLTTPVAAHAVARTAWVRDEPAATGRVGETAPPRPVDTGIDAGRPRRLEQADDERA